MGAHVAKNKDKNGLEILNKKKSYDQFWGLHNEYDQDSRVWKRWPKYE